MRRIPVQLLLVLLGLLLAVPTQARGLYVGDGRRSDPSPWRARLNLSGGLQGANDPFHDGFYDRGWNKFGGYVGSGIELAFRGHVSAELYGIYRQVDSRDVSYALSPSGGSSRLVEQIYREAFSGGVMLRQYTTYGRSAVWWGVGLGVISGEGRNDQAGGDRTPLGFRANDTGPEARILVGWEGKPGHRFAVGLELGYSFTWLDDAADFSGAVLGLRASLLQPRSPALSGH